MYAYTDITLENVTKCFIKVTEGLNNKSSSNVVSFYKSASSWDSNRMVALGYRKLIRYSVKFRGVDPSLTLGGGWYGDASAPIACTGEYLRGMYSVPNKKGPRALSPWKLRRALWEVNVWAREALKNSRYTLMHYLSKILIIEHWSYKLLDLCYCFWARKHLWGPLKS